MATAKDIMSTDVVMIDGNDTVAAAVAKMKEHGTRTLIVDRRNKADAYGIVTYRDVASEHLTCPPPRWRRPYVFRRFCASWARETRGDKCYIL